jgi:hypothetical protein
MRHRSAALPLLLAAALGCAGARPPFPPPPTGLGEGEAREVLRRFAAAVETGRVDEAQALLSARWRAGYTPARLPADLAGAGPAGREAAARVRSAIAAGAPLRREQGRASLPVGPGREAVVVAEDGSWRVDALE